VINERRVFSIGLNHKSYQTPDKKMSVDILQLNRQKTYIAYDGVKTFCRYNQEFVSAKMRIQKENFKL